MKAGHEVCATAGLHRATLEDLVSGEILDTELVTRLLDAMQARAREVKPEKLGTIGEAHFLHALTTAYGVDPNSFSYRRAKGTADGLPYVLEVACGWHGEQESGHRLYGYNCAPSLAIPFRDLHSALHEARIGTEDVLTLVVHLLCPRLTRRTGARRLSPPIRHQRRFNQSGPPDMPGMDQDQA